MNPLVALMHVLLIPVLMSASGCGTAVLRGRALQPVDWDLPPGDVARGEHLVRGPLTCTECHGADLGGRVLMDSIVFARVTAPNLTPGRGGLGRLSDERWRRALWFGQGAAGEPLLMMPVEGWRAMSAQDVADAVAYLQTLPPADNELPATRVGPVGALAVLTGKLHVPPDDRPAPPAAAQVAASADVVSRGRYLAGLSSCLGCHAREGTGRELAPGVVAPALSAAVMERMGADGFARAVQEGVAPNGRKLSPLMPYTSFVRMPREDVDAIRAFLMAP